MSNHDTCDKLHEKLPDMFKMKAGESRWNSKSLSRNNTMLRHGLHGQIATTAAVAARISRHGGEPDVSFV